MARTIALTVAIVAGCASTTDQPPGPSSTVAPPTLPPTAAPPATEPQAAPPPPPAVTVPPVTAGGAGVASEGMPGQDVTLEAIARCESGGDYEAENPTSTASGKYQVLDSTWDGYGGYERASDAPPEVQEAWAREAYARAGTAPWRASRSCWRAAA